MPVPIEVSYPPRLPHCCPRLGVQGRNLEVPRRTQSIICCKTGDAKALKKDDIYSTLRALQSRNRHPKKWLGQHYMVDEHVNSDIVEAAQIEAGELVLEIGPGTGSLTKALVEAGAHVVAVEKDPDMAALVAERFRGTGQLEVVANLPFNITTQVVKRLLPLGNIFSHVVLLLQDEAALRLVDALPHSDEYRPISLLVNFFSVPEYKFQVGRASFFPQPRVDAGVVSFALKRAGEYPPVSSTKAFFTLVNSAFTSKRKMLRSSLQHLHTSEAVQAALASVGLPETSRPDELTLDQFVVLHNALMLQSEGVKSLPITESSHPDVVSAAEAEW